MSARPLYERVDGAPFQPGDRVIVVAVGDETCDASYVGECGTVVQLEYECGCGQSYPADPMIGVAFDDADAMEFWREELAVAP